MAKGKTKKVIGVVIISLLVIIIAVTVLFNIFGDHAIKAGIEVGAKKALQVDVRLENISTALLKGKVELTNLEIDNPEGYQHTSFMKMGHAYMALDTSSLFSDTIVMDKIQLDNIEVTIEQKGLSSNLKDILNNLPKSDTEETETKPKTEEEGGKDIRVNSLDINGVTVKAKLLPIPGRADTVTLKLNPIHLENIGTDEKVDAVELTSIIMLAIAGGIVEQGKDLLPMDMIGSIGDELSKHGQQLLETGKELLEGGTDIGKGLLEGGADALDNLNPFKKKEETTDGE